MLYVKKVDSPLKGGVSVDLSPKTLILGPNGSGKTAILQALKLACAGYIDDHEGRDGVSMTGAIARLFPEESDLTSVAVLSNDCTLSWSAIRKPEGGFSRPVFERNGYTVSFPFQATKSLLSGDDKKVRSFLEGEVGGSLTAKELLSLLPPGQRIEGQKVLNRFSQTSPIELAGSIKASVRSLRINATKKEKSVDQMTVGLSAPFTEDDRDKMILRQEEIKKIFSKGSAPSDKEEVEAAIADIEGSLSVLRSEISAGGSDIDLDDVAIADQAKRAIRLGEEHLKNLGDDLCHVCLRVEADIASAVAKWKSILGGIEAAVRQSSLLSLERDQIKRIEELKKAVSTMKVEKDYESLTSELICISEMLESDAKSRKSWRIANGIRREAVNDRAEADALASLAKTWESEGTFLLGQRKSRFENAVNASLIPGGSFGVDLTSGRVGLKRNGELQTGLSGYEFCHVILALIEAKSEEVESDSTLTILDAEDRGWDPVTLSGMMSALSKTKHQVILMSTTPPSVPQMGWSVINLNRRN